MGHVSDAVEQTVKAAEIALIFLPEIEKHPVAFASVIIAIVVILCFLPNGVVTAWIERRTELKKLDTRVGQGRKKLTSGRQNRRR